MIKVENEFAYGYAKPVNRAYSSGTAIGRVLKVLVTGWTTWFMKPSAKRTLGPTVMNSKGSRYD